MLKRPKTMLYTVAAIAAAGYMLFCLSWIKDTYFTNPFDLWFDKALSAYQRCSPWGENTPCPEAVQCLGEALDSWKPADGLEKKLHALSWRAELLAREGRDGDSISDYGQCIKIEPKEFQFYLDRGNELSKLAKYDAAIADFSEALELTGYPKTLTYLHSKHSFLRPEYANNIYFSRGQAYFKKNDFLRAILDCTEIIKIEPQEMKREPPVGYDSLVGDAYHLRGKAYNRSQQYDKAIQDFSKCVSFDRFVPPFQYPDINSERGYAYMQTKQYQKAVDDFSAASCKQFLPRSYQWFNFQQRALAYKELGQADKASQDDAKAEQLYRTVSGKSGMNDLPLN